MASATSWFSTHEGATIGFTGVRIKTLNGKHVLNLYYRFAPEAQGHGSAKEAASAVITRARQLRPDLQIVAIIDPINSASIRLAEALGLSLESTDDEAGEAIYQLPNTP
ncbi:GNAT family N-acetyltransferase [Cutibacterium equinum]|uniref:GNAT family N-acetyltransferase n=1 Tax=Cutibacterium equinum TaxID=3016342 RepID=A0ABY7QXD4_9ACTN|nr:GNAT family N-acetyltransferase [Cutibacterium equinum]WCC79219.1 GNAT family N-acetyltransferase [Cutibacterium equinum]